MLGTNPDLLVQIEPPAITIKVFPKKRDRWDMVYHVSLQKNTARRYSSWSSLTNIPGLETRDLFLLLQTFQLLIYAPA